MSTMVTIGDFVHSLRWSLVKLGWSFVWDFTVSWAFVLKWRLCKRPPLPTSQNQRIIFQDTVFR